MYIHIYTYIYIYICVSIYIHMYKHICIYLDTHTHETSFNIKEQFKVLNVFFDCTFYFTAQSTSGGTTKDL